MGWCLFVCCRRSWLVTTASLRAARCDPLRAGTREGSRFLPLVFCLCWALRSPGVTPGRLYINSKYQRETSEIQENIAGKWLLSSGAVKAAAQIRENRFKCFLLFPREVLSAGSSSFLLPHVFLPFIVFFFFPSVGKGFFPLTHYNQQSQDEFFIVHLSLLQGWGWGPSMLLRSGEPSQRLCLKAHSDFSATGGISP